MEVHEFHWISAPSKWWSPDWNAIIRSVSKLKNSPTEPVERVAGHWRIQWSPSLFPVWQKLLVEWVGMAWHRNSMFPCITTQLAINKFHLQLESLKAWRINRPAGLWVQRHFQTGYEHQPRHLHCKKHCLDMFVVFWGTPLFFEPVER